MVALRESPKQYETLISLHIPKAAGSTMNTIIDRQYEPTAIFSIRSPHILESIDELSELPAESKRKIKVIRGHMPFGLHQLLPQRCTYITMLRDPIDRIISMYYYILRTPDHYLYNDVISRNMGLKEFALSKISTELDNGQTRLLCGLEAAVVTVNSAGEVIEAQIGFGECSATLLERAKENLRKHFAVVGIAERFDESLILTKRALGWKLPVYQKSNVSPHRPSREAVPKDVVLSIEKSNELDIQLYQHAKGILEELIARQGYSFWIELTLFKCLNSSLRKVHVSRHRLEHITKRLIEHMLV